MLSLSLRTFLLTLLVFGVPGCSPPEPPRPTSTRDIYPTLSEAGIRCRDFFWKPAAKPDRYLVYCLNGTGQWQRYTVNVRTGQVVPGHR